MKNEVLIIRNYARTFPKKFFRECCINSIVTLAAAKHGLRIPLLRGVPPILHALTSFDESKKFIDITFTKVEIELQCPCEYYLINELAWGSDMKMIDTLLKKGIEVATGELTYG